MNITLKSGKNVTIPEKNVGDTFTMLCPSTFNKVTLTIEKTKVILDSDGEGATLKVGGKCKCGEFHAQSFHRSNDATEAEIKEQQKSHLPVDAYSILHDYSDN